ALGQQHKLMVDRAGVADNEATGGAHFKNSERGLDGELGELNGHYVSCRGVAAASGEEQSQKQKCCHSEHKNGLLTDDTLPLWEGLCPIYIVCSEQSMKRRMRRSLACCFGLINRLDLKVLCVPQYNVARRQHARSI